MGQKEIGVHASILIVDDNAFIRRAIRLRFEGRNGFQVCGEAVDGSDAIEKARQLKPDLIILDFSMPVMIRSSGWRLSPFPVRGLLVQPR